MKRITRTLSRVCGPLALAALLIAAAAAPGFTQAGGGYELGWGAFGGAQGTATGGGFELRGQSGRFQPGTAGGGGYTLTTFLGGTVLFGDCNTSGGIDVGDAVLVLRHIVQLTELTGNGLAASDVNRNGRVDSGDTILILRLAAGLFT